MLNSKEIHSKLKELLLEENKNYVIQLYGKWGVGKTYLWDDVINDIKGKKKIVKISLFDKNSINELKEDIVLQTFAFNKTLKKYGKAVDITQNAITKMLGGVSVPNISSLLSFLKQSDFKDIIISFDDIERRNEKFSFDAFLGYVSLLKEEKKCNIVLILNYDKLKKEDKKIFNKYKEKIIDFNLILQKDFEEIMSTSLNNTSLKFEDKLKDIIKAVSTDNLRIIKHMIKMLKEIEKIDFSSYSQYIVSSFINAYIYYSYIYYSYGIDNLIDLFKYKQKSLEKIFADDKKKKIKPKKNYDEALKPTDLLRPFDDLDDEIFKVFDEIVKSHFLSENNRQKVEEKLTELSTEEELIIATLKVSELILNYRLDLFSSINSYYDECLNEIKKHKKNIIKKIGLKDFFFYIDILSKKDINEVKEIEKECITYYLKWMIEYEKRNHTLGKDPFDWKSPTDYLTERNPSYIVELEQLRVQSLENINSLLIVETLEKFNDNKYIDNDIRIINNIEKEDILNCMKENREYSKMILFFIRDHINKEFLNNFWEKAVSVIKDIYDENNDETNEKIEKIFHTENYQYIINIIKGET